MLRISIWDPEKMKPEEAITYDLEYYLKNLKEIIYLILKEDMYGSDPNKKERT